MSGLAKDSSRRRIFSSVHVGVMVMELRDMIAMKRGVSQWNSSKDALTVFESIQWSMSMVDYCLGNETKALRGLQRSIEKHHLSPENIGELAATTSILLSDPLGRAQKIFQEQGFVKPSHLVTSIDPLTVGITWRDQG